MQSVILRSDNAAYYKSASLISAIHVISKETKVHVTRYSFSEAQAGKGPADREAARFKKAIRDAIDCGFDVTTPEEMVNAMRQATSMLGYSAFVCDITPTQVNKKVSIPGISIIGDIVYDYSKKIFRAWRHFGIGKGREFKMSEFSFSVPSMTITRTLDPSEGDSLKFWRRLQSITGERSNNDETIEDENESAAEDDEAPQPNGLFSCPVYGCKSSFAYAGNLQRHIIMGSHKLVSEKQTMYEYAVNQFRQNIEEVILRRHSELANILNTMEEEVSDDFQILEEGWALKSNKKATRYSEDMKDFLDGQYIALKQQNQRINADTIEAQMRKQKKANGKPRFNANERLTASQIASYYSRNAEKLNKKSEAVPVAEVAVEEREEVLGKIIFGTFPKLNICFAEFEDTEFTSNPQFPDVMETILEAIEGEIVTDAEITHPSTCKRRLTEDYENFIPVKYPHTELLFM